MGLNSQSTYYKSVALLIELRQHVLLDKVYINKTDSYGYGLNLW